MKKTQNKGIEAVITYGVPILSLFLVYKLMQGLRIIKTPAQRERIEERQERRQERQEQREEAKQIIVSDLFDPDMWKEVRKKQGRARLLDKDKVASMVVDLDKIYKKSGIVIKYSSQVFAVFEGVKYQTQVSFLADVYDNYTGRSLAKDLEQMLTVKNRALLIQKLKNLPVS